MKQYFATIFLTFTTITATTAQLTCPASGTFNIAGSSAVQPIAAAWAAAYMTACPGATVNIDSGGSSVGARRVCAATTPAPGTPVEIGNMAREWRTNEASVSNQANKKYQCTIGDTTRIVTQIDVAIDGLLVVLQNVGLAGTCIAALGGLTIDQLRWIYSDFTKAQLLLNGWDANANALQNDDNNDLTHKWSEIHTSCPNTEIQLSSPSSLTVAFDYFREVVFTSATENIASIRAGTSTFSSNDNALVNFVSTVGDGIGFFRFSTYINAGQGAQFLYGVPIKAIGATNFITPTLSTIEAGTYAPLSRRLYMNVLDTSLATTGPFISFGLNQQGINLVKQVGYIPIPQGELSGILARINRQPPLPPLPTPAPTSPPPGQQATIFSFIIGDPHITTLDGLQFDCQARGEFTFLKSIGTDFHIQSRFTKASATGIGSTASVTSGIVVRELDAPIIQISYESRAGGTIQECRGLVKLYENGIVRSLSSGATSSKVSITVVGQDEIVVLFPDTKLEIHILIKSSLSFGCFFTQWIGLPENYRANETLTGLLGNANDNPNDDWQTKLGTILPTPDSDTALYQGGYDYCRTEWCIRSAIDSLFTYGTSESYASYFDCDAPYESDVKDSVAAASLELKRICGTDVQCIIDGVVGTASDAQSFQVDTGRIDAFIIERNITLNQTAPPTAAPTRAPTKIPTRVPTKRPTRAPTKLPTRAPTKLPTRASTKLPTRVPIRLQTRVPTKVPTRLPARAPILTSCGLFGLSIFCPLKILTSVFCGVFGSLLGICRDES